MPLIRAYDSRRCLFPFPTRIAFAGKHCPHARRLRHLKHLQPKDATRSASARHITYQACSALASQSAAAVPSLLHIARDTCQRPPAWPQVQFCSEAFLVADVPTRALFPSCRDLLLVLPSPLVISGLAHLFAPVQKLNTIQLSRRRMGTKKRREEGGGGGGRGGTEGEEEEEESV